MNDRMRAIGIAFPKFEGSEMADLLSYLHFIGFFGEPGEATVGEAIFGKRGCASCHAGPEAKAVDLATSRAATDPIALSAAMWNHAPEMHGLMAEQAVAWPTFDPGDMKHLAAYLRKVASQGGSEDP